jgi:hypothetical protein
MPVHFDRPQPITPHNSTPAMMELIADHGSNCG